MLPLDWKPNSYGSVHVEPWEEYALRIQVPAERAYQQFFRQVVYDHLDHFNLYYPSFELTDYELSIVMLAVRQVVDQVKYFGGEIPDEWCWQFDEFMRINYDVYPVFRFMRDEGTVPFPPVVIDSSKLILEDCSCSYGCPLHLVEGTHRVGYLIRMAQLEMIDWNSSHEFLLLTPR